MRIRPSRALFTSTRSLYTTSSSMTSNSSHPIVKPTILGKSTIDERIPLDLDQAKWISLELLKWTDQDGKKRGWEMAKRNTTSKGGVDGTLQLMVLLLLPPLK